MPLGNAGKLSSLGREKGILSFFFLGGGTVRLCLGSRPWLPRTVVTGLRPVLTRIAWIAYRTAIFSS